MDSVAFSSTGCASLFICWVHEKTKNMKTKNIPIVLIITLESEYIFDMSPPL
jgi:hypothetical protein